jgi:hypothetical protein
MRIGTTLFIVAALAAAAPSSAQDKSTAVRDALLGAIRLPEETREARVLGVPERDIRTILGTAREQRVPLGVLHEVLVIQNEAVREHGPVDNFGAFVQSKLKQGMRGRDLSAAIRAEHAAHGIGKGKKLKDHGNSYGHAPEGVKDAMKAEAKGKGGKPETAGHADDDHGKPDAAGASDAHGKPDAPGKSGGKAGKKGGS